MDPTPTPCLAEQDQPRLGTWTIWLERPWRVVWSDQVYDQYGIERGTAPPTNQNYFALMHPSDANPAAQEFRKMLADGKQRSWRFRIVRPDGKIRHVLTTAVPTTSDDGVTYVRGVDHDVTEVLDDQQLFDRERAFRFVADNVRDVVFRCSADSRIEFVSRSITHLLGYDCEELIGRPIEELVHPEDRPEAQRRLTAQIADRQITSKVQWEHRLIHKNGSPVWIECAPRLVFDANSRLIGWVDVVRDISARRASDEQVQHMARHDALTGLPNRTVLDERLNLHLQNADGGAKVAVLCLDLDRFKTINDTLGHQVGDELLRQVADRLLQTSEKHGAFVSRLGGDEFVVVLVGASESDAVRCAQDCIATVSSGYQIEGQRSDVGLSVGVAFAPEDARDASGLLRAADVALYHAKAEGRGVCCRFQRRMDESRQARRRLEIELREAFNRNAFELFYQPVTDLASGRIVAVEALLRWRGKDGKMILPSSFVQIAEETGLIVPLGEWVLREACLTAAGWPDDITVAVNLSPVQLRKKGLVTTIVSALAKSGVPAERLELELTESALLGDDQTTLSAMHQLKRLGVRIALDDFGTGYSSLGYLQRFPFDKLKIDGSFVRNMQSGPEAGSIVRAVIALGAGLGMVTTGEGVETSEQLQQLRNEGCVEAQGNYLYPPLSAKALMSLPEFRRRHPDAPIVELRDYEKQRHMSRRVAVGR